ncbi:DEAD/DEAH box helicase family protein [uncultured Phascolarctobacterium sp.]|uniref:DEAD/DEAH box helicase n=1 Tax=uncultured Phascolarctobacterium sp. TaxID=512296 RepID=UPI0025D2E0D3|nr:DEAD/DEAH box helicase family protein [uncultured Phascolarctobacterium sp.]
MKCQLFPFQSGAVKNLRLKAAEALGAFKRTQTPQVVSLQAPTGAGKTIIISALIEDIFCGTDAYLPQADAIFVWLSDSPSLNAQSQQKIEAKTDKIRLGQCVTIEDNSFDQEFLSDGCIYFLNTQKLSKSSNLAKHSDSRQYTIWETLQNTLETKSDRLYFIIDEAHRGSLGNDAGKATSIMQRFLKGSPKHNLSPMPLVIGMSATAQRFNKLVEGLSSTIYYERISAESVRESGLLKDRIIIIHPQDMQRYNDMAVLDKATDEWQEKCKHWRQYCTQQHYKQVEPAFIIQVQAGNSTTISHTDIADVVTHIEKRLGRKFNLGEVVHTFGSTGDVEIAGLKIFHVEPEDIADDRKIKVVLFKENLSTGWDCPRAETMMSFRTAEDTTYIAQLLGRMVRTPLQNKVLVDDYLNDVRLFLPYFNQDNVAKVVAELQSSEVDDIPTIVDEEDIENPVYVPWHVRPRIVPMAQMAQATPTLFPVDENESVLPPQPIVLHKKCDSDKTTPQVATANTQPASSNTTETQTAMANANPQNIPPMPMQFANNATQNVPTTPNIIAEQAEQMEIFPTLNREKVLKHINGLGMTTYTVKSVQINNYLKSVLALSELLTSYDVYRPAKDEVTKDMVNLIRAYIGQLKAAGQYSAAKKQMLQMKLSMHVFDIFGAQVQNLQEKDLFIASDEILDPQLTIANAKLGNFGLPQHYARYYWDDNEPNGYKVDCILFAASHECLEKLNDYAKEKFHALDDEYRNYIVFKGEKCFSRYRKIVTDSDAISKHILLLPEIINAKLDEDGTVYKNHLYADDNGIAKIKLNSWEKEVVEEEMARPDFICWLRNPAKKDWSLCLPYEIDGQVKGFYPDFIIVRSDPQIDYVIDILEPHSDDFKDNLAKAKSLAKYVEDEPHVKRVQMIRKTHGKYVRLDFSQRAVRESVRLATTNDEFDRIFKNYGFSETS